jgi:hypothetical protein
MSAVATDQNEAKPKPVQSRSLRWPHYAFGVVINVGVGAYATLRVIEYKKAADQMANDGGHLILSGNKLSTAGRLTNIQALQAPAKKMAEDGLVLIQGSETINTHANYEMGGIALCGAAALYCVIRLKRSLSRKNTAPQP